MNRKFYDLTNPQKSILLTEEFYKGTNINNICGTAIIKNELNFELLKKAISLFIKNNDSFSLKLTLDNNEVKQYIGDIDTDNIAIVDIESKDDLPKLENDIMSKVFDVYDSNLFSFTIFRFKDNTGGFIANVHHLIGDSWTLGIIANEIVRIYSCIINGVDVDKSNENSYINYINSEKEYLNSDKFKKDKEYWNNVFNTIPEQASIPSSKLKISNDDFSCKANRSIFNIDKSTIDKITEFCKSINISVFNFFMAVYSIYISRVSGLSDFVIGTPILNRTNFKEKHTTGMFINTSPLRVSIDDDIDFNTFASNIAKASLSMLRHQKYYYQNILEDLRNREPNLPNLYSILISYQITKASTEKGLSYTTRWNFNGTCADDIDIHLFDLNDSGSINIAYDYKVSKYEDTDITSLHNRILHIIEQILSTPSISIKDIEIVTNKEKNDILNKFNNTNKDFHFKNNIIEVIKDIASSNPDKVAIEAENDWISYKDLIDRVNKLSNYLITQNDLNPNCNIGIFTYRNIDTIVGILAIININCTYVPIDPEYPVDRINYMIEQSKITTILSTDSSCKNLVEFDFLKFIPINYSLYKDCKTTNNLSFNYNFDNNLYIIFTSGSTGKPKGVTITHKNMMNLIFHEKYCTDIFSNEENHKVLQFATMSFDVSYQEIFSSLLTGSTLVLISDEKRKNIKKLSDYIAVKNIDTLFIPPAYLRLLTEDISTLEKFSSCVKNIITAGEALLITSGINKLLSCGIKIHNHYGPAETHVATTYTLNEPQEAVNVPIGYPISNTSIYILDEANHLCPSNVKGQIAIAGACVGNGYVNRDDLTKQRFISDPFVPGNKLYLTGDLGFWDNSGCIHYIGRSDFQVKINGFRIELQEIDKVLSTFDTITNCISVVQIINNKKYIITYYCGTKKFSENELKNYLNDFLPKFMIPYRLVYLDKLPLNNNGKIDRKKLPNVDLNFSDEFVAPTTETEIKLAKIWDEIFNVEKISNTSDFFNIGGDSLLAIKLVSMVNAAFNINITVSDVYNNSKLQQLSKFIDSQSNTNTNVINKAPLMDYYPLSSAQKRIYYSCKKFGNDTLTYNITGGLLVDKILDKDKLVKSINTLINRHSIFRTNYVFHDDDIKQYIRNYINITIPIINDTYENLDNILKNFQKPFDLEKDILLRASIYYLNNSKTLLLIDSHHIALDGVSLDIFLSELCKLYNNETLPNLQIDYKDFSVWENDFIQSDEIKPYEDYWMRKFNSSTLPSINLPYDYVDLDSNTMSGDRITYEMDNSSFKEIDDFAKKLNVSNYTLLLSVLFILLYKYTNQEELIVGSASVGRTNNELYNIVGDFVNNIVVDAKMRNNQSFKDFINYLNAQIINDLDNQIYPYDLLVKKLSDTNENFKNSIFDVSFTYQNANTADYVIDGITAKLINIYPNTAKFNLLLEIQPKNHKFSFEYNTSLFKKETIKSLLDHYLFILKQLISNENISINDIEIITPDEKELLNKFNDTYEEVYDDTMVSLFEKEVKNNPDNIALICEDKSLTYNELNKKANSLAHYLIEKRYWSK